jgi:putative spermidine/putrescine transport system substrate-binding protein
MSGPFKRRDVITAGLAAAAYSALPRPVQAQSKPMLNGLTWGGPWVRGCKEITAKQSAVDVNWALHAGSAANSVAKIKASWPDAQYDFVHAYPPVFYAMLQEGWLEPYTAADIPNIAHVPPEMPIKNAQGELVSVPVSSTGSFWIYDEDALGMKIEKPRDLLSPKVKGKLLMTPPAFETGTLLVSLARGNGGSETNIDPGFEFAKELAKSKAVGRVATSDTEVINAFTTGEVAVGVANLGNLNEILKHRKMTLLNKVPQQPMFKFYTSYEGFVILKGTKQRKAVMDFINFFIDAQNDSLYCQGLGHIPVNDGSSAGPEMAAIQMHSDEERKNFTYFIDPIMKIRNLSAWNKRWDLEVVPLLQG